MKIGIMADTHDNLPMFKKAIDIFNRQKVDMVLHAGDYVAPFSLEFFHNLNCDYCGVFGNNDGEKEGLTQKSGGRIKPAPQSLTIGQKKIILTHSLASLPKPIEVMERKGDIDLVIYGHTHEVEVARHSRLLVVNPGEVGGWLKGRSTVAIVDTRTMAAEIIDL